MVVNVCIFKVISFVVVVDSLVHGSSIVGFPTHPHVCWWPMDPELIGVLALTGEGMEGLGNWYPQGTGIPSLVVYLWRSIGMMSRAEDMQGCSAVSSTVHKRACIAQSLPAGYPSEF